MAELAFEPSVAGGIQAPAANLSFPDSNAAGREWSQCAMAVIDPEGRILHANERWRSWFGSNSANPAAENSDVWQLLWTAQPAWREPMARELSASEAFLSWDLPAEVGEFKGCCRVELARHEQVTFIRIAFLSHPSQPGDAERRLQNLYDCWPGVVFRQRLDLTFAFVTRRIEDLTGLALEEWEQLPARFWHVFHEGDVDDFQRQLKQASQGAGPVTGVYRIRHARNGRISYVLEHRELVRSGQGEPLGYDGFWLDISRQVVAEKRLTSTAWKETLLVLTMGLAHDFNNILTGIHSISEDYLSQVASNHPFHEGLGLIKRNALQASDLIHRIVNLHRGKIGQRGFHNLNDVVAESLELIRKVVPRRIQVECNCAAQSLPIYSDAVELRQVLVNLALNAVDAMPQGGRLRFATSRHESYPALEHVEGDLPRLPSACVSIEDNGSGIPKELLAAVFDAFFTTKSADKGSGLGLYNARLFAEKHHGAISIDSREKMGTAVRVWLPEANFTEADGDAPSPRPRFTILLFSHGGAAADNTAEFLRASGFSVAAFSSVEDASEFLRRPDFLVSAVMLLARERSPAFSEVVLAARRGDRRIKVIAQVAGRNEDEFEAALLEQCDLVLRADMAPVERAEKIGQLLAQSS
jgi:PAS domain S-box-containing protein